MSGKRFRVLRHSVLDTQTGLEWQRDTPDPMSWGEAMEYAKSLRLGGHADWRLPSIEELTTLIDFSRAEPASKFPGMPSECLWSSSSYSRSSSSYAWLVYFDNGYVFDADKSNSVYVRCVRRGQ